MSQWTKRLMDKTSQGQNVPRTKRSREKTSQGTKRLTLITKFKKNKFCVRKLATYVRKWASYVHSIYDGVFLFWGG